MRLTTLFTIVVVSVLLPAGCTVDGDTDDAPDQTISGRLAGVPHDARRVQDGYDELSWTAADDGTAYFIDASAARVILHKDLRDGDRVRIEPDRDLITVDGRPIYRSNLASENRHSIWWVPDQTLDRHRDETLPAELDEARRVSGGRGELSFRVEDDGRVWIWDKTADEIIYRGEVLRGDRLIVSPEDDSITIDTSDRRAEVSYNLNRDHEHELYFRRR